MDPTKINEEIAKRQREIAALQSKRRKAESDEDYEKSGQAQAMIVELGRQIDKLIAQLGKK
jgi:hypothetical protein